MRGGAEVALAVVGLAAVLLLTGSTPIAPGTIEPDPWPYVCRVVMPEDLDR